MVSKTKQLTLMGIFGLSSLLFGSLTTTQTVSAHTATINTSGAVQINLAAGANANVASDNLTVNSTCSLGYNVSISGPADTNLYQNGNSTSTNKISPSAGTMTTPATITGSNLGTWGYSMTSTTADGTFIGLSNTANTIFTKNTASSTSGDTIPVYYGASATGSLMSGNYTMAESTAGAHDNVVTYTVTTNPACDSYTVRYNGNGADTSTTMSITHSNVTENSTIDLAASNFKKTTANGGTASTSNANTYGFAGWSTEQLDPNASDFKTKLKAAVTAGKVYGPNETITADQTFLANPTVENNTQYITLYAIWVKSEGNLQNWTGCSAMNEGDVTALTDQRDNNTYTIAKLKDGNCWMVENLRLDDTATLTAQNTNNPALPLTQDDGTTANHLSPSSNSWCAVDTAACYNQSRLNTSNTTNPVSDMTAYNNNANIYSLGNYYNWYSVTAGNGTYPGGNFNVPGSICPAGWRLAHVDALSVLDVALGGTGFDQYGDTNRWRIYPNNITYSGWYGESGFTERGVRGEYWANSALSTLIITYDYLAPATDDNDDIERIYGRSARCLTSDPYTISFNPNGGSGDMASQTAYVSQPTILNANTFTAPFGKQFAGWNTAANGSGISYADLEEVRDLTTITGQTVTLYAQWELINSSCPANTICYDGNGADTSTAMGSQSISATDTEATLWASNFERSRTSYISYAFAGWNTEPDYTGVNYGPNETVHFTAGDYNTGGIQLYAHWVEFNAMEQVTMQYFDNSACATKQTNQVFALLDERDGNAYAVAKLADGNCWMIENLRLGSSANLDVDNTDNPLNASGTATLKNDDGNTTDHLSANSMSWCTNEVNPGCLDQSKLNTDNVTDSDASMTFPDSNIFSYGNYYNWYSATAGTGTSSQASGNASGSICPAGWHLPTGGNSGEYKALSDALGETGSNALRSYPNNFLYSGSWYFGSSLDRSEIGYYWSATASSNTNSRLLYLDSSNVNPNTSYSKNYGLSVRCLIGS